MFGSLLLLFLYFSNKLNSDQINRGIYSGDLNEIPLIKANIQVIHRSDLNCKNKPSNEYGIVRTMYIDSSSFAVQEFLSLANAKIFVRTKNSNTWSEWKEK